MKSAVWWYSWNPRSVKISGEEMSKRLGSFTLEKRSCETWSRGVLCPCASRPLVRRFQFAIMKQSSDEVYGPNRAVPPVPRCQGGWIIQSLGLLEPLHSTILLHVTAVLFRPANTYMQPSKWF